MTRPALHRRNGAAMQPESHPVAPIADFDVTDRDSSWWSWRTARWFGIGVSSGVLGGLWCRPGVVWTAVVAVAFAVVCAITVWEQASVRLSASVAVSLFIGAGGAILGCGLATGEWRRVAWAGVGAAVVAGPWLTSSVLLQTALITDGEIMLIAAAGLVFGLFGIAVASLLLGWITVLWLLRRAWSTIRRQHTTAFAPMVVNAMLLTLAGVAVVDAGDLVVALSR